MSASTYELSENASSDFIDAETLNEEFPALKDVVYLDHAATTLVSKTQLDRHRDDVLHNLYGNPHSHSPSSQLTTDTIDQVRYSILKFFNTTFEDYTVIFTAGCTASLKLLSESFSFHENNQDYELQKSSDKLKKKFSDEECLNEKDFSTAITDAPCDRLDGDANGVNTVLNDKTDTNRHNKGDDCNTADAEELINRSTNLNNYETCSKSCCCHSNINLNNKCCLCGSFTYLLDNHTSVQGMRELAFDAAGKVQCIDCDENFTFMQSSLKTLKQDPHFTGRGNHLFLYPAQSNFNGTKYPLDWVTKVNDMCYQWQQDCSSEKCLTEGARTKTSADNSQWFVCLDAASLVSTSALDLGKVKPDFVTLSFYKMFGFPTGLGALIVKNSSAYVLKKTYFGGGTVSISLPSKPFHVSRSLLSERFEDGTMPFLDIVALKHGFDILTSLAGGISRISQHTFHLAQYFYNKLSSCYHGNRAPLAIIYCKGTYSDSQTQGGIVNFNVLRSNGEYVGYAEVDKLAHLFNIHLRTGCFCNIGACQKSLNLTDQQLKDNFQSGHVCGDNKDLIDGKPTGSVRISFGYMSTLKDAQKCLQFITDCFLENTQKPVFWTANKETHSTSEKSVDICSSSNSLTITSSLSTGKSLDSDLESGMKINSLSLSKIKDSLEDSEFYFCSHKHLNEICLYPVKSCGAYKVREWLVGPRGLMYDREWMIVTESGIAMSQKREKNLCLIKPSIDIEQEVLTLNYPGMKSIRISMRFGEDPEVNSSMCNSKVCGDRVQSIDCGQEVADWLSEALQRPGCRLLRQKQDDARKSKLAVQGDTGGEKSQLSLANECQYLLINQESVMKLQQKLDQQFNEHFDVENLEDRFRANLIVSGCAAFEEDGWTDVQIGAISFKSQGVCTRCQMVCLDQHTGDRNKTPLQALTTWKNRKTSFGVLLCTDISHDTPVKLRTIKVGDPVFV